MQRLLTHASPQMTQRYACLTDEALQRASRVVSSRYFFAFDPARQAVVLVGGSKAGDKRFYERLIPIADARFANYLSQTDATAAVKQ